MLKLDVVLSAIQNPFHETVCNTSFSVALQTFGGLSHIKRRKIMVGKSEFERDFMKGDFCIYSSPLYSMEDCFEKIK